MHGRGEENPTIMRVYLPVIVASKKKKNSTFWKTLNNFTSLQANLKQIFPAFSKAVKWVGIMQVEKS